MPSLEPRCPAAPPCLFPINHAAMLSYIFKIIIVPVKNDLLVDEVSRMLVPESMPAASPLGCTAGADV